LKYKIEEKKRLKCGVCHSYLPDDPKECKRCIDLGEKIAFSNAQT